MDFGRPDYQHIKDQSEVRRLGFKIFEIFPNAPQHSFIVRLARKILNLRIDEPIPEPDKYFPDSNTHLIPDEEPVFLLRAKDELAVETLEHWISLAKSRGVDQRTIDSAERHLAKFKTWYKREKPNVRATNQIAS